MTDVKAEEREAPTKCLSCGCEATHNNWQCGECYWRAANGYQAGIILAIEAREEFLLEANNKLRRAVERLAEEIDVHGEGSVSWSIVPQTKRSLLTWAYGEDA